MVKGKISQRVGQVIVIVIVITAILLAVITLAIRLMERSVSQEKALSEAAKMMPLKIQTSGNNVQSDSVIVTDEKTGVSYIVVTSSSGGVSICPRYNLDGSLYLGDKND